MAMRQAHVFRKKRVRPDDDARILPLINIVFLLLIFFMVAGRLSATDPFEIIPPQSASGGQPANEPMLIAIGPQGQLALNGELVDEAALIERITAAGPAEDVRIKSDGRVEALTVVALMDTLRGAGINSVRLMTVPVAPGDARDMAVEGSTATTAAPGSR